MNDKQNLKNLDTSGLICPEPVMLLHKTIRDSAVGDVVEVIATDPSTQRDVPAFCEFLGHELIYSGSETISAEQKFVYRIRKGGRA